ncbi:MAG: [FeFe] hydrogenase H-cluster radical SAM maturase HydE [Clostridiaceae bacterium]|nr:[FeFe] hydrogenase H-cluster radical SAM maturase HydE [Clostridiaceae bacterium]
MLKLIDKLEKDKLLTKNEFIHLLSNLNDDVSHYLFDKARNISQKYFGNKIYVRGLIEFTNYCINDCLYCGIRRSNKNSDRYRLTKEQILSCCKNGYKLGFRTFVLQGGEDLKYKLNEMVDIISTIRSEFPDCAITLSMGEKTYDEYLKYFEAGANRYLLRHETANIDHFNKLHTESQSLEKRKECLFNLKKIGYQVGTGFMVGSPYQTYETLAEDLLFIHKLKPEMIGIGPFVPHKDTPLGHFSPGKLNLTLFLIGILRLMLPNSLIPATTALGTIDPKGRELGILAGANVVMPNLSPIEVRSKYLLYDGKICTGEEAAECRMCLQKRMESIGYELAVDRGDYKPVEAFD